MDGGAAPAAPAPRWTPPTGPATRLVLVRHGSTAHSGELRLSGRNDLAARPGGQRAGRRARRRAPGSLGPVAAVVSSPLRRARQTADWIASALGASVVEDEAFAELDFGAWEGLTARRGRGARRRRVAALAGVARRRAAGR